MLPQKCRGVMAGGLVLALDVLHQQPRISSQFFRLFMFVSI